MSDNKYSTISGTTFTLGCEGIEFSSKDAAKMASEWLYCAILDKDREFIDEFKSVMSEPHEGTKQEDWDNFVEGLEGFIGKINKSRAFFSKFHRAHYYRGQPILEAYQDDEILEQCEQPEVMEARLQFAKVIETIVESYGLWYIDTDHPFYWGDLLDEDSDVYYKKLIETDTNDN